jgi:hypothetical protein
MPGEKEIPVCMQFCFQKKKHNFILNQWFPNFLVSGSLYTRKTYLGTPKSFGLNE